MVMRAVERGVAELVHSMYWSTLIEEPCRRGWGWRWGWMPITAEYIQTWIGLEEQHQAWEWKC